MRRFGAALGAVVAGGVALRIVFVATAAAPLPDPGDAMAYHLLADGLADGDGYVRPYDRRDGYRIATAEYAPAFPAVLAAADLAGIDTPWGQRYAIAALGGFAIALTGVLGRRVGDDRTGLIAATIIAGHPLVIGHDTTLLTEGLVVAAAGGVLLLALQIRHTRTAFVTGVVVGLAILVRADAALLLIPVVIAASGSGSGVRFRSGGWRPVAAAVGAALLVVAPWTVRSALRLDAFVPVSTNAGSAVGGANCAATYGSALRGYWTFRDGCFDGYERGELLARGEAAVADREFDEGVGYARSHPSRLPAVALARVARVWGVWDLDQQVYLAALEGKAPGWERTGTVVGWLLLPLAAAGLVVTGRRRGGRTALVLAGPLIAVTLTGVLVYGNPRFRAAAEPAIAVLAATPFVSHPRGINPLGGPDATYCRE